MIGPFWLLKVRACVQDFITSLIKLPAPLQVLLLIFQFQEPGTWNLVTVSILEVIDLKAYSNFAPHSGQTEAESGIRAPHL